MGDKEANIGFDALTVTILSRDDIRLHDDGRVYATFTADQFFSAVNKVREALRSFGGLEQEKASEEKRVTTVLLIEGSMPVYSDEDDEIALAEAVLALERLGWSVASVEHMGDE